MRLHHVQVSCPVGGEDAARRFYADALGIPEVAKPPVLAARGGCWFRGEQVTVTTAGFQAHVRELAGQELPARCSELARLHAVDIVGVQVRDQRSRWGACSPRRAITLNWRLVQMPPAVSDYVMLHELAHVRHPNHSRRFWREVERLCPAWRESERWLRRHGRAIL